MKTVLALARVAALAAAVCGVAAHSAEAGRPPNILLIVADDLGYGDVGCYGATAVATPNIDRLAAHGRRFTTAYAAASTCTPARYALLTGEYAWRQVAKKTSILNGDAPLCIEPGRLTLPELLRRAGYATGLVGKWHLGIGDGEHRVDFNGEVAPGPLEVGFDSAFYIPATLDRVPTVFIDGRHVLGREPRDPIEVSYEHPLAGEPTGADHPERLKFGADAQHSGVIVNGISRIGWMTGGHRARWVDETVADVLCTRATRFIEANRDRPFFLYYGAHEPHVPRAPDPRFVGATKLGRRGDVIAEFDWVVGQLLAALERSGTADNTVVMLTSDNGPVLFDGYFDEAAERNDGHQPAGGLRGWKYLAYEGGTRVPFIVHWAGHVRTGVDDRMLCQTDLLATFANLTRQHLPAGAGVDSIDQLAVLTGEPGPALRREVVEQAVSHTLALRQGAWKFIRKSAEQKPSGIGSGANPADQRWAESVIRQDRLYNLAEDPRETTDLAASLPDRTAALRARLEAIEHLRQ